MVGGPVTSVETVGVEPNVDEDEAKNVGSGGGPGELGPGELID